MSADFGCELDDAPFLARFGISGEVDWGSAVDDIDVINNHRLSLGLPPTSAPSRHHLLARAVLLVMIWQG